MTLNELKENVAESTGMSKTDTEKVLRAGFAAITNALKSGDDVNVPGFGSFSTRERASRMGHNPRTGEKIQIPASRLVKFKAGKRLKDAING
ncbi:MAG: HU family DNA-binding protein [Nitrospirae bacterium]|nr:HU family DNA-binding protein [Magnetococcales bacterium]